MLKRLIFAVSKEIELPVYNKSDMLVCRLEEVEALSDEEVHESLYVCDDSAVARELYLQGKYVVALLTNNNDGQDFSFCSYAIMDAKECEADFFEGVMKRFLGEPWEILEAKHRSMKRAYMEQQAAERAAAEQNEVWNVKITSEVKIK